MVTFIIRRLIGTIFLLIVVSMITFAIFFLIPRLAGQTTLQLAAQYVGRNPTKQAILQVEQQLGLADPLYLQYGRFLRGIVLGAHYRAGPAVTYCPPPCFGYSFRSQLPVWPQMVSDIPVTLSIAIGASVLWLIGGVSIGVLSALRKGTLFDRFSMGIALAGVSLPVFFTGLISLELFSYKWPIFPNVQYVSFTTNPLEWARNLILPWTVLAFLYAALYARLTRAGMLETMSEDYIRTARAKGLPERKVIVKHGLRAALTPIVTIFGMDLGLLLGGAIITEVTFSMHGLGLFTVEAVQNQDLPEILGVTMLAAFFIVLANLVVDILYAVARPEGEVLMPEHPARGREPDGSSSRPRTAWSSRWTACRSASSGVAPWASSASRVPARASPASASWACTRALARRSAGTSGWTARTWSPLPRAGCASCAAARWP